MLIAGVGRTELTPFAGVELTGWGYYIQRVWRNIRDPLFATAVVFSWRMLRSSFLPSPWMFGSSPAMQS
jgi:hypothetical protein